MKAFQIARYSKTDLSVQLTELERPRLVPHEVLIQVKAAGVNPLDNMVTRGEVKLIVPYQLPLTMGHECSGVIAEVGAGVTDFARLPNKRPGAFAEYVAVEASAVAPMPKTLDFVEAASIPLTALTAYQALELLGAKAGESIFISGGSGGLGAMAIPLAKARGLIVYTNGNAASRERVLGLGADRYLDYKSEDYLKELPQVDYVLDSLGGKELSREMKLLKAEGKIVSLKGLPNGRFARRFGLPLWKQWLFSLAARGLEREAKAQGATYEFLFVESSGKQLRDITQLIEQQGIRPSVDKVYPFAEASAALAKVAAGGAAGKVVLQVGQ